MHWFIEACNGNKNAQTIDVYQAVEMTIPGIYAYYSVLDGGKPQAIPNLRNKNERDAVRFDDRKVGRDLPSYSKGDLDIDPEVYERIKKLYQQKLNKETKK